MDFRKFIALLLAACLLLGLLTACGSAESETDATEASEEVPEAPFNGETDVTVLSNYSISEASPHDRTMSSVVAIDAQTGEPAMTNGLLQFYYWIEFFSFMNYYGEYASYFGLDAYSPLSEQASMSENRSWEQYFLESATEHFSEQYSLYRAALDNGYVLTEEDQAALDDVFDPNGSIATGAAENGFESAEAYMQYNFGPGVDLQDYYDYVLIYRTAFSYKDYLTENTDEETAGAYYDAHEETFAADRVQKLNNVSVRHILIQPEGEQDEEGNYSEEAWATAEETANEILAQWQEDPTEDNFAALANENSADSGSNTTGGLYEDFDTATMVQEFTDWSFDPERAYGDTGIVKTTYGYHIMFFVEQTETKGWMSYVVNAMIEDMYDDYPLSFDYSRMRLFDIMSIATAEMAEEEAVEETLILPEDEFDDNP